MTFPCSKCQATGLEVRMSHLTLMPYYALCRRCKGARFVTHL